MDNEIFDEDIQEYFHSDPRDEELDYKELITKLEDASFLEDLTKSEHWRMFKEAWRRIYKQAEVQLDNIDPANTSRIVELQLTKRFYRDMLGTTIRKIKEDGKAAFEQAKSRGLLNKLFPDLKKDF